MTITARCRTKKKDINVKRTAQSYDNKSLTDIVLRNTKVQDEGKLMEPEIFKNAGTLDLSELAGLMSSCGSSCCDVFDNITRVIVKMLGAPLCTVRMLDGDTLRLEAAQGILKDAVYAGTIGLNDDCMGMAVKKNESIMYRDLETLEKTTYNIRVLKSKATQNVMFLPIRLGNKPAGVITICSPQEISEEDCGLLDSVSSMVSSVMEKASLQKDIKRLYLNAVKTLVKTIEAKDIYTKGHSLRVSQYASSIAKKLGFSQVEVEEAEVTGMLHDIGKIGVNDLILTKPDCLSEVEFQLIKQHPFLGSKILEPIGFSENIINGTLLHHKRYDLKGYPSDVDIAELPMMPRIIGAADAFDAMTSIRPYKRPMHKDEAINEMKKLTGTQFCPQVVGVMEQLYTEDLL